VEHQEFGHVGEGAAGDAAVSRADDGSAGADRAGPESLDGRSADDASGRSVAAETATDHPVEGPESATDRDADPEDAEFGGVPDYRPTGRADVDAVLDRLSELDGLPPSEHIDIYEDAHRRLHETLVAAGEGHASEGHAGEGHGDPAGTS
jgi:hypothetical protein